MPKKFKGENSRVTKAKAIKAVAAAEKKAKADKHKAKVEAAEWKEGANNRAAAKKEAAEKKRIEKEAARQLRKLQEAEESKQLDDLKKTKKDKKMKKKITGAGAGRRPVGAGHSVAGSSVSGGGSVGGDLFSLDELQDLSAVDIDGAIHVLGAAGVEGKKQELDRHPEKRRKSAYAEYFEREAAIMKAENPHLRQSQIKNKVFKMWKKSPDNPMNQESLAYNSKK